MREVLHDLKVVWLVRGDSGAFAHFAPAKWGGKRKQKNYHRRSMNIRGAVLTRCEMKTTSHLSIFQITLRDFQRNP